MIHIYITYCLLACSILLCWWRPARVSNIGRFLVSGSLSVTKLASRLNTLISTDGAHGITCACTVQKEYFSSFHLTNLFHIYNTIIVTKCQRRTGVMTQYAVDPVSPWQSIT